MVRKKIVLKELVAVLLLLLSASIVLAQPAPVAKTGNQYCGTSGEDGCYQKGVAWPVPRFTDKGDGTVTDNLTGLVWTKNANFFGQKTWEEAIAACESLEKGNCGCNPCDDWRLPNRFELESLLNLKYYNPALSNTIGNGQWTEGNPFTDVQIVSYWSSTTIASSNLYAWDVDMGYSFVAVPEKVYHRYVWPVRGPE